MKILENLFPKASVLLSTFHVIKYLKQKVSGELIPVSQKAEIMAGIKKVIYSRTMKDFDENVTDLETLAPKSFFFLL